MRQLTSSVFAAVCAFRPQSRDVFDSRQCDSFVFHPMRVVRIASFRRADQDWFPRNQPNRSQESQGRRVNTNETAAKHDTNRASTAGVRHEQEARDTSTRKGHGCSSLFCSRLRSCSFVRAAIYTPALCRWERATLCGASLKQQAYKHSTSFSIHHLCLSNSRARCLR